MRILLITYYFPPLGGAGVQRTLKFSKYLLDFGITPVVIAADEPGYPTDSSLLNELPQDIEVHRILHIPTVKRMTELVKRFRRKDTSVNVTSSKQTASLNSKWRDRILNAIGTVQYPDDKYRWGKEAYKQGKTLLEKGNIDLILSSSPPITAHNVAAKLKRRFGIPWVADYRDLWTENPSYDAPSWRYWLDRQAEKRLLEEADGVTAVTKEITMRLQQDILSGRQAFYLPNGYDEADFAGLVNTPKNDNRFTVLYTGSLYGHQSPESILLCLRSLFKRRAEFTKKLCLRFIGNIGSRFEPLFSRFENDFPGVVERIAYVPHQEIPSALVKADALLLLIGGGSSARGVLTGKIFEYLRARRPVLMLGPTHGEAAKIIEDFGCGSVFEENDIKGASETLEQWLDGAVPFCASAKTIDVTIYERNALTGQLAGFLRKIHGNANV